MSSNVNYSELDAFIWDSTRLEYEAARSCDLITSGGVFGRAAYGIGLPKNSDWTDIISLAILHMHESGEMEDMDAKWITGKSKIPCKADDDAPVRLGLMNMRDLFILVAGGMAFGAVFIIIEIVYSKRKAKRLRRKQLGLYYVCSLLDENRDSCRFSKHSIFMRLEERQVEDICLPNEFFKFCSAIHDNNRRRSSSIDSTTSLTVSSSLVPPEPTKLMKRPLK
uniref:Uncharacterized protein n=1 Tax=Romanomermis culicivorax TaxID=13658 RepID=A0A915HMM6_ROMCU